MQVFKTVLAGSFIAAAAPVFAADAAQPLTDAQRAEVRALVQEVMADANTRATLADGAHAGIDSMGKVFLKSDDGKYLMNIGGWAQARYGWNSEAGKGASGTSASNREGFDVRRVNLDLSGYVGDPRVSYDVLLGTYVSNATGTQLGVEQAYAEYQASDEVTFRAGRFYLPYAREFTALPYAQVAVERSSASQYFSLNRGEGVQIQWSDNSTLRVRGALTNGGSVEGTTMFNDTVNFAGVGRAELLVAGSDGVGFHEFNDNFAWFDGNKQGLLLGVAGYYQEPASSSGLPVNNVGATADATFKIANLSFYGAGFYATDNVGSHNYETHAWGAVGQLDVALNKQVDIYAQYSHINDGTSFARAGAGLNTLQQVALGANYRLNSHVKLTGDVVWVFNGGLTQTTYSPVPGVASGSAAALNTGSGLVAPANSNNEQVAVRLQLQVGF